MQVCSEDWSETLGATPMTGRGIPLRLSWKRGAWLSGTYQERPLVSCSVPWVQVWGAEGCPPGQFSCCELGWWDTV